MIDLLGPISLVYMFWFWGALTIWLTMLGWFRSGRRFVSWEQLDRDMAPYGWLSALWPVTVPVVVAVVAADLVVNRPAAWLANRRLRRWYVS